MNTQPTVAASSGSSPSPCSAFEAAWREMEAVNPLHPDTITVPGGMSDEVAAFLDEIGRADTPEKMAELIPLPNVRDDRSPASKEGA